MHGDIWYCFLDGGSPKSGLAPRRRAHGPPRSLPNRLPPRHQETSASHRNAGPYTQSKHPRRMTCGLRSTVRAALVGHLHGRLDPTAHETIHVLTGSRALEGPPPFLPRLPPRARSRSRRDPWRRRRRRSSSSSRRRRSPRKTLPRRARSRGRQARGRGLSPGRSPTSRSPAARPRRPAPRGGSRRSRHHPPSPRVRALRRPPPGPRSLGARPHRRSCGRLRRRLPPRRPLADNRG